MVQSSFRNLQEKAEAINWVLLQPTVDLWKLREFALTDGGLVNDTLRKRAWPKLVGLGKYSKPKETNVAPTHSNEENNPIFEFDTAILTPRRLPTTLDLLVECMDKEQIDRDVARCTWHLLTGSQRSRRNQIKSKDKSKKIALLLKKKQRRLANLINVTLVESYGLSQEKLRYYQGYHDVACIFLHALGGARSTALPPRTPHHKDPMGLDLASRVLCQVSFSHFRDNLRSNFLALQTALKVALYPLLLQLDIKVHNHLLDCDMEPFFCLSWVLTWFSHDVRDTNLCKRLFDAFLASHPLFVLYVALAMMLHPYNRQLILQTDCDFAALHQRLVSLPRNSCKVGWKKTSWDGGYISDHDDDDDDDEGEGDMECADDVTTSTDFDGSSSVVAPSTVSSQASVQHLGATTIEEGAEQRVPFQLLIDRALDYMALYPPRCLGEYARRYYGEDNTSIAGISLLQEAPTSSLVSTAPADWVLKQRLRQEMGLTPTSRKDRRKKVTSSKMELDPEDNESLPDYEYLKRHSRDRAVIAVGYGPGPEAILSRKRRNRRLTVAMGMGFLTMTLGLAIYQYSSNGTISCTINSNSSSSSTKATFVKRLLDDRGRSNVSVEYKSTSDILATSVIETADSVLEYCKLPINFLLTVPTLDNTEGDKPGTDSEANTSISSQSASAASTSSTSSRAQLPKSIFNKEWLPWLDNNTCQVGLADSSRPTTNPVLSSTGSSIGGILEDFTFKLLRFLSRPIRILMQLAGVFVQGHLKGITSFLSHHH